MTSWYLDTSAAFKLLASETESDALAAAIRSERPELAASQLLETELRRAAVRSDALTQEHVTALLEGVALYQAPASLFREAGRLPGTHLRSLDALHIATAVRIGADAVLTYDTRMLEACRDLGVPVVAPGRIA